ncbi:hypothetical protein RS9916_34147 [Synechococcus sp. RS9916]|nr:hypothetical protein RS9916_34147 [Synechococcus sp. RS9916]
MSSAQQAANAALDRQPPLPILMRSDKGRVAGA